MQHRYTVGTFCQTPGERRWRRIKAYTRNYHDYWPGCVLVRVTARSGADAKRRAIRARLALERGDLTAQMDPDTGVREMDAGPWSDLSLVWEQHDWVGSLEESLRAQDDEFDDAKGGE